MIPAAQAPPFEGTNEYFDLTTENVFSFYKRSEMIQIFQQLQMRQVTKFMAYRPFFVE